jgi:hypothetical protein
MFLHLPTFLESERARLFEQPRWQSDFSNVVDETAQVNEPLLLFRQSHPTRDISRIDSDRSGMASCITVPRVKCGNQSRREREARALKTGIRFFQARYSLTLLLIKVNQALQSDCWDQERADDRDGVKLVAVDQ